MGGVVWGSVDGVGGGGVGLIVCGVYVGHCMYVVWL